MQFVSLNLKYLVPVLFTFYTGCAKIKKKIIPAPKVLMKETTWKTWEYMGG